MAMREDTYVNSSNRKDSNSSGHSYEDIYANEDIIATPETRNNLRSSGIATEKVEKTSCLHPAGPQYRGNYTKRSRCYRRTTVCLGLLCAVLLVIITVLTIDRNQLQTSYTNLTIEEDQIQTSYTNLTIERDQLQTSYTNLTIERDQLQTSNTNLTIERDQLQKEKDTLQKKLDDVQEHNEKGWLYFSSSFYFISTEKKSWTESRRFCKERGADLVIIKSREEQNFLAYNLRMNEVTWIGLTRDATKDEWKWVDGSALTNVYWNDGEPNNTGEEYCVEFYTDRKSWNDRKCSAEQWYICEKRAE